MSKKPWPMKWVVLAIVLFIAAYTVITLRYRKPGRAFEPYEDTKNRATTNRLLSAGFRRLTIQTHRPAELSQGRISLTTAPAPISPAAGGVPADLRDVLIDQPRLPIAIDRVTAPAAADAQQDFAVQFTCTLADNKQQLAEVYLYVKDDALVFVPSFEPLDGDLLARTRDLTLVITVPAGRLPAGSYSALLVGAQSSRAWELHLR